MFFPLHLQGAELGGVLEDGLQYDLVDASHARNDLVHEGNVSRRDVIQELVGTAVQFGHDGDRGDSLLLREPRRRQGHDDLAQGEHGVNFLRNAAPRLNRGEGLDGRGGDVRGALGALGGGGVLHGGIVSFGGGMSRGRSELLLPILEELIERLDVVLVHLKLCAVLVDLADADHPVGSVVQVDLAVGEDDVGVEVRVVGLGVLVEAHLGVGHPLPRVEIPDADVDGASLREVVDIHEWCLCPRGAVG